MSGIYEPLLVGQIRLIRLLPGEADDEIRCQLETHQLGNVNASIKYEGPAYEAISYVWGDANDTKEILVNDKLLSITTNLFDALRVFRKADASRTLWADAICINQQNLDERAVQVTLMASIFSACAACNIWLGKADGYGRKLMPPVPIPDDLNPVSARHIEAALQMDDVDQAPDIEIVAAFLQFLVDPYTGSDHSVSEMGQTAFLAFIEIDGLYYRAMTSLLHVLCRPWWYRTWTIQEVVLPCRGFRKVAIVVGSDYFDFKLFLRVADCWFDGTRERLRYYAKAAGFIELYKVLNCAFSLIRNIHSILDTNISPIQSAWRHLEVLTGRTCTDPRDAIYGLSGLFPQPLTSAGPDYRSSVGTCYSHAMKEFIAHTSSLDYLQIIHPVLDCEVQRPSWVIDFSKGTKGNGSRLHYTLERGSYTMSGTSSYHDVLQVRSATLTDIVGVLPAPANLGNGSDHRLLFLTAWAKAAAHRELRYLTLLSVIWRSSERGFHDENEDQAEDLECYDLSELTNFVMHDRYEAKSSSVSRIMHKPRFWKLFTARYDAMGDEKLVVVILRDGRIGTAYECTRPGDSLAILEGAKAPVILRPAIRDRTLESGYQTSVRSYHFLGSCNVNKPPSAQEKSDLRWRDIDLV